MRLRGDEQVSTLAPVVESEGAVADNDEPLWWRSTCWSRGARGNCRLPATRFLARNIIFLPFSHR